MAKQAITTTDKGKQPKVDFILPEVVDMLVVWQLIDDCLAGQITVKNNGQKYLIKPNADDTSAENEAAWQARLKRAVFYNVTGRTHKGLVGQVFAKPPSIDLPASMLPLVDNIDGSGVQLDQQAKIALGYVVGKGRAGLWVDYPSRTDEDGTVMPTTKADLAAGNVRPTISLYRPEVIINWRTKAIGSLTVLTLIVLQETCLLDDDGFEPKYGVQYRILRLDDDGKYTVDIMRRIDGEWVSQGLVTPLDGKGLPFDRIPFQFIGVENNDVTISQPPLLDLALLNIAHFNNSADNEDSVYLVGCPMFTFSGLTEQWVKGVLGGKVRVGSSVAVLLPVGGAASVVQASPNTMAFTNMEHKERQMVALGAKLVQDATVQRTATEAAMEESSEVSTLISAASNVSQAYRQAFVFVAKFLGLAFDDNSVAYELNTDLAVNQLDASAQTALVASWQSGVMDFEEVRWNFRRSGLVYKDDDMVQAAIEAELMTRSELTAPAPDPNADPNEPIE